ASSGEDEAIRVWDVATRQARLTLRSSPGTPTHLVFSPDSRQLASALGGTVRLWDIAGPIEQPAFGVYLPDPAGWTRFAPDSRTVVTLGEDRKVTLWDPVGGKARTTLAGPVQGVRSVTFAPDGRTLALLGVDNTVTLWDLDTGQQRGKLQGLRTDVTQV